MVRSATGLGVGLVEGFVDGSDRSARPRRRGHGVGPGRCWRVGSRRGVGEGSRSALVGVRTRGVPIAERIAERLAAILGEPVPVGALDITLYRDDLGDGNRWPVLLGTEIPFPVDGAEIVLVDDVLYTGRTIRAALNAICDLGRPAGSAWSSWSTGAIASCRSGPTPSA